MDKRHIYGIMIDTETTNSMEDPFFYDVGWQVIDTHGRLYKSRSFINSDIFVGEQAMMRSAYYASKIPQYLDDIKAGDRILASFWTIRQALHDDVKEFGCKFICAHNARFDYKALNGTMRWLTSSKYRYFTPYGLEWWDTLKMAKDVIAPKPMYREFCFKNGFIRNDGKPRLTAEILYRFIAQDVDFVEEHKGLQDVDIERQILAYCVRQKKKMDKRLWRD